MEYRDTLSVLLSDDQMWYQRSLAFYALLVDLFSFSKQIYVSNTLSLKGNEISSIALV